MTIASDSETANRFKELMPPNTPQGVPRIHQISDLADSHNFGLRQVMAWQADCHNVIHPVFRSKAESETTRNRGATMKAFFMQLISSTEGKGPSSTRLVYLVSGLMATFSAVVMTLGGVLVYCGDGHKSDPNYWIAVVGLWTAKLGIGGWAKAEQQKRTKEIKLGQLPNVEPATAPAH